MNESTKSAKPAQSRSGATLEFEKVSVLLVDPDRAARDSIRGVLHNNGFRNIETGGNFAQLRKALEMQPGPDLLICEADLEGGDLCALIHDLRNQRTKADPFLPVIAITWSPTPELVQRVVNSGADDMLVKPLSTDALLQRIYTLAVARRPFVVTNDYVGPDRHRTQGRPNKAKLLQAPNRLSARTVAGTHDADFQAAVNDALAAVNGQKIGRHVEHIEGLLHYALPILKARRDAGPVTAELDELTRMAAEAIERSEDTAYDAVAGACRQLTLFVELILTGMWDGSNSDIERLTGMLKDVQTAYADAARRDEAAQALIAADAESAPGPDAVRREKFLLRLLTGKISHLLNAQTGRKAVVPRPFLLGFERYLIDLLGQDLYDDLNPKAKFLLERIGPGSDATIWETIQDNDEYWAFSEAILARVLLRFADFQRGRAHFMEIVKTAMAEAEAEAAKAPGGDAYGPFTDGHFDIVFTTLFADIFYALATPSGRKRLDAALGANTAAQLDAIHGEFRRYLEHASQCANDR